MNQEGFLPGNGRASRYDIAHSRLMMICLLISSPRDIEMGYNKKAKVDVPSSDNGYSSARSSSSDPPGRTSVNQPPQRPPAPGSYEAYVAKKEKYKREWQPTVEPKREKVVGPVLGPAQRKYFRQLIVPANTEPARLGFDTGASFAAD